MDPNFEPVSRTAREPRRIVGAPFDRAALAQAIADLSAKIRERDEFRKAVVPLFQQVLTEGHVRAREALEAGGRGLACARFLCDLEDELIRAIYDCVTRHVYPIQNPSTSERMAVCAVGGYGRVTLAPGSDNDLLFLFPPTQTGVGASGAVLGNRETKPMSGEPNTRAKTAGVVGKPIRTTEPEAKRSTTTGANRAVRSALPAGGWCA